LVGEIGGICNCSFGNPLARGGCRGEGLTSEVHASSGAVRRAGQAVDELAAAPTGALADGIFLGVGPTAIAFLTWAYATWAYALNRTGAGTMAATTLAVPAIAAAFRRTEPQPPQRVGVDRRS
jgi:hypothetical protein